MGHACPGDAAPLSGQCRPRSLCPHAARSADELGDRRRLAHPRQRQHPQPPDHTGRARLQCFSSPGHLLRLQRFALRKPDPEEGGQPGLRPFAPGRHADHESAHRHPRQHPRRGKPGTALVAGHAAHSHRQALGPHSFGPRLVHQSALFPLADIGRHEPALRLWRCECHLRLATGQRAPNMGGRILGPGPHQHPTGRISGRPEAEMGQPHDGPPLGLRTGRQPPPQKHALQHSQLQPPASLPDRHALPPAFRHLRPGLAQPLGMETLAGGLRSRLAQSAPPESASRQCVQPKPLTTIPTTHTGV